MKDSTLWLAVFLAVIGTGIIIILFVPLFAQADATVLSFSYRLASIFLGMLGGLAAKEFLSIRANENAGRSLLRDLIEELRVNEILLEKRLPLRKGFWTLGIRSGLAAHLPERERRQLWRIYPVITHYNDDLMYHHRSRLTDDKTTKKHEVELDRLVEVIGVLIRKYLDRHGISKFDRSEIEDLDYYLKLIDPHQ